MSHEKEIEKWLIRKTKENLTKFPKMPKEIAQLESAVELHKRIEKMGILRALEDTS